MELEGGYLRFSLPMTVSAASSMLSENPARKYLMVRMTSELLKIEYQMLL